MNSKHTSGFCSPSSWGPIADRLSSKDRETASNWGHGNENKLGLLDPRDCKKSSYPEIQFQEAPKPLSTCVDEPYRWSMSPRESYARCECCSYKSTREDSLTPDQCPEGGGVEKPCKFQHFSKALANQSRWIPYLQREEAPKFKELDSDAQLTASAPAQRDVGRCAAKARTEGERGGR